MNFFSFDANQPAKEAGVSESAPAAVDVLELLRMLVSGIALHSIEENHEDFNQLRLGINEVTRVLNPETSADDMRSAVAKALQLLEAYNQKLNGAFKGQVEELRSMIAAMAETLQFVTSSSETSVKQLGFMELQLQRATQLDDLRQLRTFTSACLSLVRRESIRVQDETQTNIKRLQSDVDRLTTRLQAASAGDSTDSVTGLPMRVIAEQDLQNRIVSGRATVFSVFYVDRLIAINGRFGNAVGDEILMHCAQLLAKRLSGAKLYRWSGPAICAIFDPMVPAAQAETRARQAAAQQLERHVGDRHVLVIVSFVCSVHHLTNETSLKDLLSHVDDFLTQQNRQRLGASSLPQS